MTTEIKKVGTATTIYPTQGSSALKSIVDDLSDIIDKEEELDLDLSNVPLTGVLQAYEEYIKITSPKYTIQRVIGMIEDLESRIGKTIMPIKISNVFNATLYKFAMESGNKGRREASTVNSYMGKITAALNWATAFGCKVSKTFRIIPQQHSEHTKVALSLTEIAHIYKYQIDKNRNEIRKLLEIMPIGRFSWANLHKVRDQFVLDFQIGQRYSDAHNITQENFSSSGTILNVTQQKTSSKAVVNLMQYALDDKVCLDILKKYNYEAPAKHISTSTFNKYIHLLLRAIGDEFNEVVQSDNRRNGIWERTTKFKWEAITSHTARRTFVTYHVEKGTNILQIQLCSGHRDIRSMQKYFVHK